MNEQKSNSQNSSNARKSASKPPQKQTVALSAFFVAVGTLASRVLGLGREIVLAAFFPRMVTDAFIVAFRLPNMFRRLLGEGALSLSFVPLFVETLSKEGEEEAKKLANGVFTILMVVVSLLTALGTLYVEDLLGLLVSGEGYLSVPGKFELTVQLGQVMFAFIFLMSTYAYFMGILQSFKIFALPAMAPALFNLCVITAACLPVDLIGLKGEGLAWAVLVGGGMQMGVLIPRLWKLGFLPKLTKNWNLASVRRVGANMVPTLIGMGIWQIAGLINVQLASRLGQGSHSYINWADRILELPHALFAVSMGTALLPTLSEHWAKGDAVAMGYATEKALRQSYFIIIPCAIGFALLGLPIVEVLYMRGRFGVEDALMTSQVVQIYGVALLVHTAVRVVLPSFYAIKNTWFPAVNSVFAITAHLLAALYLMEDYGIRGLAMASVIGGLVNLVGLLIAYRIFIGVLRGWECIKGLLIFSISGAVMALAARAYDPVLEIVFDLFFGDKLVDIYVQLNGWMVQLLRALTLFTVIGFCALTYFAASHLLRVPEMGSFISVVQRRLKKR